MFLYVICYVAVPVLILIISQEIHEARVIKTILFLTVKLTEIHRG